LPSVYPNPNRIVHDRASGFRLTIRSSNAQDATWGNFRVGLRLVLKGGGVEHAEVRLDFRDAHRQPARDLPDLPAPPTLAGYRRVVKRLKAKGAFGDAREVLCRAEAHPDYVRDPALREKLLQQRVLCTYKDPLLPLDARLADARRLVAQCASGLRASADPETLGIAGAIYKRLWEVDSQRANLEQAFQLYRQGYAAMLDLEGTRDYDGGGYTGVNAAFVADLICDEERRALGDAGRSGYDVEALRIRIDVAARLEKMGGDTWWHYASLAEAYLGLASRQEAYYEKATTALDAGMALRGVADWEHESTAAQLSALVELQVRLYGEQAARGRAVVSRLVPENP